ncbi:MAG TPA: hypothetical protein VH280_13100 [Verrucomicrobiae bacterium]|nr:hypothetical protein [Verrucomicrobiae bacterium]
MNYWKVILATIVIFGAGVLTGGLLVNHVDHPAHPFQVFHPPRPLSQAQALYESVPPELRPRLLNTNFVQRLTDKLNLTPKQAEQIRKIIGQSQSNTHDLWKLVAPQFQLLWRDTNEKIKDVLTPEQKWKYDQLLKQQRQLRRQSSTNAPPAEPSSTTNAPAN